MSGLAGLPSPPTSRASHVYVGDYCEVRDLPTPYQAFRDHDLTVLDWTYMVPRTYAPPDLVPASSVGFTGSSGAKTMRRLAAADLGAMRSAAAAAGHALLIQSAFRSYEDQQATFNHWVQVSGYQAALLASARPGHSEHQLGTAIDFTSPGVTPWEHRDWATTPAGSWMAANAWRYGFVMSYPRGGTAATCYQYEPWHYRWIGRHAAAAQRTSGLTLRQYLDARLHAQFVDIRWTPFESEVVWLASTDVTRGCVSAPARFCPIARVSRAQMASFLARALELPATTRDYFTDDDSSLHENDVNRLAAAGITGGCASGSFCPSAPVSREQMASFLARAFKLAEATSDRFDDDGGSIHETDINRLAESGITGGCASGAFCPRAHVTREQMAAFLYRAMH
jgi:D-alanyl-D-alanine carboxypeptidase